MLILSTTLDDLLEGMKKGNKEMLQNIYAYSDNNVNKFCYYCTRILSKSRDHHPVYYTLINHLEEIGDTIKYLALQGMQGKREPALLSTIDQLKTMYGNVMKLYHHPTKEALTEFNKNKKAMRKQLTGKENPLVMQCVNYLVGMVNAILLINAIKN